MVLWKAYLQREGQCHPLWEKVIRNWTTPPFRWSQQYTSSTKDARGWEKNLHDKWQPKYVSNLEFTFDCLVQNWAWTCTYMNLSFSPPSSLLAGLCWVLYIRMYTNEVELLASPPFIPFDRHVNLKTTCTDNARISLTTAWTTQWVASGSELGWCTIHDVVCRQCWTHVPIKHGMFRSDNFCHHRVIITFYMLQIHFSKVRQMRLTVCAGALLRKLFMRYCRRANSICNQVWGSNCKWTSVRGLKAQQTRCACNHGALCRAANVSGNVRRPNRGHFESDSAVM